MSKIKLIPKFIGLTILGGLILSISITPAVALLNYTMSTAKNYLDADITDLSKVTIAGVSELYANDNVTKLATFYTENRIVVPIDQISLYMQQALISHEDKNFYSHGGIDIIGTLRAAIQTYIVRGAVQGGSGITQQYVKNMLIYDRLRNDDPIGAFNARDQNLFRKLREAKQAIELDSKMSKAEILQGYFNVSSFGRNIYGVEAASQRFFDKHAKDLNIVEAATLAGIPQNPNILDPTVDPVKSENQRNIILGQMLDQGYITQAEHDTAVNTKLKDTLHIKDIKLGCQTAGDAAFFCDYISRVIETDPIFGETPQARQKLLYQGGLKIYSTLDEKYQKNAKKAIKTSMAARGLGASNYAGAAAAMTSVEPGTGKILAMAQSRSFSPVATSNTNETAINYSTDQIHGGSAGFPPGSTIKLFELADWIGQGYSLNTVVPATPRYFQGSEFPCAPIGMQPWKPFNAVGAPGSQNIFVATQQSTNVPFINMATRLSMCSITATAAKMGFKIAKTGAGLITDPQNMNPSILLGQINASPLNMAESYATAASGGIHCDSIAINKIINNVGVEIPIPAANCLRVIPQETADVLQYLLKTVQQSHSEIKWDSKRDAGFKTGTSDQGNHIWAAAFTPQMAAVAWVGNPNYNVKLGLFGASVPLPIVSKYLYTSSKGLPYINFNIRERTGLPAEYLKPDRWGIPVKTEKDKDDEDDDDSDYSDDDDDSDDDDSSSDTATIPDTLPDADPAAAFATVRTPSVTITNNGLPYNFNPFLNSPSYFSSSPIYTFPIIK
jgi:membrane peptidoglycan carboxypeptidase